MKLNNLKNAMIEMTHTTKESFYLPVFIGLQGIFCALLFLLMFVILRHGY